MKWIIVFVSFALCLIAACRELKSGKVVDKHYSAGYYYTTTEHHNGHTSLVPHYHDAEYKLRVEGYNKKGELITEWWYVTSGTYEYYRIGSVIKDTTTDY